VDETSLRTLFTNLQVSHTRCSVLISYPSSDIKKAFIKHLLSPKSPDDDDDDDDSHIRDPPTPGMSPQVKFDRWQVEHPEKLLPPDEPYAAPEDQDDKEPDDFIPSYHKAIHNTPAYEWLLTDIRRELLLAPPDFNLMDNIAHHIREEVSSIPAIGRVSPNERPKPCEVSFELDWQPLAFIKQQEYGRDPDEAIERAVTLTGNSLDAQAVTTREYMCQTWPMTGSRTLALLKNVIRDLTGSRHTGTLASAHIIITSLDHH
jgi:hypothetical protein